MNYFSWTTKFKMAKNPFKDVLDTSLFFRTRQHEEALVKIQIGIEDRHAIILLTGSSGTGKTMISQVVLRSLDSNKTCSIFVPVHSGMGKGALLDTILKELDVEQPARHTGERLAQLQDEALKIHEQGKQMVLLIDEAHFLKADALHILRTLTNLETEESKLITVILIAEESLVNRLQNPAYASLRGRITFSIALKPLTAAETEQYIKYRLLKCGAPANLLTNDAYQVAHHYSSGTPRDINRILYNSFIESMASDGFEITPEIIRTADQKTVLHG